MSDPITIEDIKALAGILQLDLDETEHADFAAELSFLISSLRGMKVDPASEPACAIPHAGTGAAHE